MDQATRAELEKIHGRINDLKERVVNLEAQNPHINAALIRIEQMVERLNGHLVKAIWAVFALFLAAVVQFTIRGGWINP